MHLSFDLYKDPSIRKFWSFAVFNQLQINSNLVRRRPPPSSLPPCFPWYWSELMMMMMTGPDAGPCQWELRGEQLGHRAQLSPRRGSLQGRGGRLRGRDRTEWNQKVRGGHPGSWDVLSRNRNSLKCQLVPLLTRLTYNIGKFKFK